QTLLGDKEIPRLTGRSCGEFPGIGRTFAFAPLHPDRGHAAVSTSVRRAPSAARLLRCLPDFRRLLQIEVLIPVAAPRGWPTLARFLGSRRCRLLLCRHA